MRGNDRCVGAIASMWLGVHLVPISIGGRTGVMPLLPVPVDGVGHRASRHGARATPPQSSGLVVRWVVASALGGPLLMAALPSAVIHDASSVVTELQTPCARSLVCWLCIPLGRDRGVVPGRSTGASRHGDLDWLHDSMRAAAAGVLALLRASRRGDGVADLCTLGDDARALGSPIRYSASSASLYFRCFTHPTSSSAPRPSRLVQCSHWLRDVQFVCSFWAAISRHCRSWPRPRAPPLGRHSFTHWRCFVGCGDGENARPAVCCYGQAAVAAVAGALVMADFWVTAVAAGWAISAMSAWTKARC